MCIRDSQRTNPEAIPEKSPPGLQIELIALPAHIKHRQEIELLSAVSPSSTGRSLSGVTGTCRLHGNLTSYGPRHTDHLGFHHLAWNTVCFGDHLGFANLTAGGVRNLAGPNFLGHRASGVRNLLGDRFAGPRASRVGDLFRDRFTSP